jgi:hypothetical protein
MFFSFNCAGNPVGSNTVDYIVVAGGGGSGYTMEAVVAVLEVLENQKVLQLLTASPLASATALPVSVTTYPITVGGGGAGGISPF